MLAVGLCLILLLASCGGSDSDGDREAGNELAGLVLQEDEAPDGLELQSEDPIDSVREVLPPSSAAPQLPSLPTDLRRSLGGGYEVVFSGTPDQGPTKVSSSVLRFSDASAADRFLEYLREVQTGEITLGSSRVDIEAVEAPNLGEEGYAWHVVLPGGESSGSSWRDQGLVFALTLGGPVGRAPAATAVELARTMEGRLS